MKQYLYHVKFNRLIHLAQNSRWRATSAGTVLEARLALQSLTLVQDQLDEITTHLKDFIRSAEETVNERLYDNNA